MKKFADKAFKAKIDVEIFTKLKSIFESKGWPITYEDYSENVFEDFCDMLGRFNEEQQKLILELTENYLWIGVSQYSCKIRRVFSNIYADGNKSIVGSKVIHVVPLLAPKDFGKTKSSSFLAYLIKGEVAHIERLFGGIKIIVHDNYDYILKSHEKLEDSIIFLVDDYIGSGDTAESAVMYLCENKVDKEKLVVATLIAQNEGAERIKKHDILVYFSELRYKGITDNYSEDEAKERFRIMDAIENKIHVRSDYKYGYNKTEALVSLNRTPNNTFPIFWLESKMVPVVPFVRRG